MEPKAEPEVWVPKCPTCNNDEIYTAAYCLARIQEIYSDGTVLWDPIDTLEVELDDNDRKGLYCPVCKEYFNEPDDLFDD